MLSEAVSSRTMIPKQQNCLLQTSSGDWLVKPRHQKFNTSGALYFLCVPCVDATCKMPTSSLYKINDCFFLSKSSAFRQTFITSVVRTRSNFVLIEDLKTQYCYVMLSSFGLVASGYAKFVVTWRGVFTAWTPWINNLAKMWWWAVVI